MVSDWKRQAMEGLMAVFADRSAAQETAKSSGAAVEKLHAKIGQLLQLAGPGRRARHAMRTTVNTVT
jgi:hypothetical protein